jgi:uncharacterized membrane protein
MVTLADNVASAPRARGGNGTRRGSAESAPRVSGQGGANVGTVERAASVIGGGALALYGTKRKDLGGALLALVGAALVQRGATGHCPVYEGLGLDTTSEGGVSLRRQHGPAAVLDAARAIKVERAVSVMVPAPDLYRFWRNFENLPRIMDHLESVTVLDPTHSHWTAKAPAGTSVEWDAVIHNEIPNELIAWKSVDEAQVPNAGSVRFRELGDGRGTEVKVTLEYQPPAGRLGRMVAKLFGEEPEQQVREDLRRFKAVMESGEAPTTEGQPRCG